MGEDVLTLIYSAPKNFPFFSLPSPPHLPFCPVLPHHHLGCYCIFYLLLLLLFLPPPSHFALPPCAPSAPRQFSNLNSGRGLGKEEVGSCRAFGGGRGRKAATPSPLSFALRRKEEEEEERETLKKRQGRRDAHKERRSGEGGEGGRQQPHNRGRDTERERERERGCWLVCVWGGGFLSGHGSII